MLDSAIARIGYLERMCEPARRLAPSTIILEDPGRVDVAMHEMRIFGGALQRRLLGAKDAIGYRGEA